MLSLGMTDSPAPPPVTDELSAPLGQKTEHSKAAGRWQRIKAALPLAALRASAGVLGCITLAFLGWVLFAEGPLGGEPMTVAKINLQPDDGDAKQVESSAPEGSEGNRAHPNRYDGPPVMAGQPATAPRGG